MTALHLDGYWAEAVVRSPDAGGEWPLSGAWSDNPADALGWLHDRALWLADVLDPHRLTERGPAEIFREWVAETDYYRLQLDALSRGQMVSANARGPDRIYGTSGSVDVLYSFSARPIHRPAPFGWQRIRRRVR